MSYDDRFFASIREGCRRSAEAVAPAICAGLKPRTVLDVGCGEGWWGKAFAARGCEVLGVDGDYVAKPQIPFLAADLSRRLPACGNFDLAICLEVAEHLPPDRSWSFVAELCGLATTVLFSAAVPGQGGQGHLNEQWPDYWADRFAASGYRGSGALRWAIWNDDSIKWWYRQNLLVFGRLGGLPEDGTPAVVHPDAWRHHGKG